MRSLIESFQVVGKRKNLLGSWSKKKKIQIPFMGKKGSRCHGCKIESSSFFFFNLLLKRQDFLYLKPKKKRTCTENYMDFFQI